MFRKENGVTLVALVITIIVLLILAGVTISMVLGDDGIISQASGANIAQQKAALRDHVSLALATMRTEDVAVKAGVGTAEEKTNVNTKTISARLIAYLADVEYTAVEGDATNKIEVTIVDGQGKSETVEFTVTPATTGSNYSFTEIVK